MRVKLSLGNTNFTGYENINPFTELDKIFDNSATEIYLCHEVLSKVENKNFNNFLNGVLSKLRRGGTIIITGPDCHNLFLSYIYREVLEQDLCDYLKDSSGFYNCRLVEEALIKLDIKIESMSINNNFYHVRGTR